METFIFLRVPSGIVTTAMRRLGDQVRFVCRCECDTLHPTMGFLPVISHFLDIVVSLEGRVRYHVRAEVSNPLAC